MACEIDLTSWYFNACRQSGCHLVACEENTTNFYAILSPSHDLVVAPIEGGSEQHDVSLDSNKEILKGCKEKSSEYVSMQYIHIFYQLLYSCFKFTFPF